MVKRDLQFDKGVLLWFVMMTKAKKNQTLPKANVSDITFDKITRRIPKGSQIDSVCHHFSGAFAISLSRE